MDLANNQITMTAKHCRKISIKLPPTQTSGGPKAKALRPRDAATLILIDRSSSSPKALMGRRSAKHVFMPDLYVFPGGRRDRDDWRLPIRSPLRGEVIDHLLTGTAKRFSKSTAQALANAAARELYEETNLNISPEANSERFDVSHFRFFARAITPIGQPRRFDTRFFTCFCDELHVNPADARDSDELLDLSWVDIGHHENTPMPDITSIVLGELHERLRQSPSLPFSDTPYFFNT